MTRGMRNGIFSFMGDIVPHPRDVLYFPYMDKSENQRGVDPLLWKQVVDGMPLRIYVKSVEDGLRYVLCNKTLCDWVGKTSEEVVGQTPRDLFLPEVADCFEKTTRLTLENGGPNTVDEFDVDAAGVRHELRTTEKLYETPDGRHLVFGYCMDVTEESSLQRVGQTIDEVSALPIEGGDFLQEVFTIVTRADRLDVVELRWVARSGSERREIRSPLAGEPMVAPLSEEDRNRVWKILRRQVDAEGIAVYTDLPAECGEELSQDFRRSGYPCLAVLPVCSHMMETVGEMVLFFRGKRTFSPRYVELLKFLGRTLSVARNRIYSHRELAHQLERAEEAERAKNYFFASVSHDIRTPLNSIIGFSELLKASSIDDATRKRYVEAIASSGQVLLQLVNDVLDLAKLEAGKMQFFPEQSDFRRIVQEITLALLPQAQSKGLQIKSDIEPGLPFVEVDRQRIRQVLFNLVGNAVKFTDHGFVQISAEFRPDPSGQPFGTFRFGVIDTGRGISDEDQQRLMKPFVQLSRTDQGHGTGLGLAICRQLVGRMGGELSIESRLGVGSLFRVVLPNIRFTREIPREWNLSQTQRIQMVTDPRSHARLRFLLVDDMDLNLQVLKNMFIRLGVQNLVLAHNGQEAIFQLEKEGAPFDAVLTDMWMPEMGGGDLVKRIRGDARFATLPVFAVTADVEIIKTYQELGFTGLLLKPITLQTLTEFLENFSKTSWK